MPGTTLLAVSTARTARSPPHSRCPRRPYPPPPLLIPTWMLLLAAPSPRGPPSPCAQPSASAVVQVSPLHAPHGSTNTSQGVMYRHLRRLKTDVDFRHHISVDRRCRRRVEDRRRLTALRHSIALPSTT
ncbi:hypothetical protein D9611_007338 [Ephemerocybe angulata]|uniref:Uncharacterized protein n=1 Tax=Ephemerocybe angulata TaxID=980116 RepID=A0A8H5CFV5_9AGAR|nr:hypothetical protein D9611_007338 [Tulosesus angulatus]